MHGVVLIVWHVSNKYKNKIVRCEHVFHSSHTGTLATCFLLFIAMTILSLVNKLLEKFTKAQENTQQQLANLRQVVTDAQADATKKIIQKLETSSTSP